MFVPFSAFTQLVFAITPLHSTRLASAALAATEPHNVSIAVCARESFLFPHSLATCTFLCDAGSHAFTLGFLFHIVDLLFLHTRQSIALAHQSVSFIALLHMESNDSVGRLCADYGFSIHSHQALDECAIIFFPTPSVRNIDVKNSSSSSFTFFHSSTIVDRKDGLKLSTKAPCEKSEIEGNFFAVTQYHILTSQNIPLLHHVCRQSIQLSDAMTAQSRGE